MKSKSILSLVEVLLFLLVAIFLTIGIVNADTASTSASITNSVPSASAAALNGGSAITLTSNLTKTIVGTATITDNNGCEDISSVTAVLFRTNVTSGPGASDNNQTHYAATCSSNSDCTAGGSDITETYNCSFSMTWYADPTDVGSNNNATDWTFNVTPSDGSSGVTDSAAQEVNTLTSLFLETSSIAFGSLALGADTGSTNQNTSIANHGNEGLDVSLTGYGATSGDSQSMNCTIGSTAINKLKYNSTTFTFSSGGIALSNTSTELDLDIAQGSDSTRKPTKLTYYGFGFPSTGVGGSCTGTVVITAVSDPTLD